MSSAVKFAIVSSAGPSVSWRTHPRVEKTNACNASYGERRGDVSHGAQNAATHTLPKLSQIETASCEPDWNGPRLTSAFVAQVLGQVLTAKDEAAGSALSAYRGQAQIASALLCDRRI
jgi:hypothetical protein